MEKFFCGKLFTLEFINVESVLIYLPRQFMLCRRIVLPFEVAELDIYKSVFHRYSVCTR